jgi:type I restriction enzyme R subunit
LKNVHRTAEAVGLDESGFAIYELLGETQAKVLRVAEPIIAYGSNTTHVDGMRRDQAAQILAELQELAIVDWVHKEDVQRRMRQAVKRRLRGSNFPREQIESLTSKLMDLARVRLAR